MTLSRPRRLSALWLAAWLLAAPVAPALAQTRVVAPVEGFSAPASPAAAVSVSGLGTATPVSPSLLSGPALGAAPSAPAINMAPAIGAAAMPAAVPALGPAATPALAPAVAASPAPAEAAGVETRSQESLPIVSRRSASSSPVDSRAAAAIAAIENGAASWENRGSQALDGASVLGAASDGARPLINPEWPDEPARPPAPDLPAPEGTRPRPRLARALFASGAVLVAAASLSFVVPVLLPAAVAAAKGPALYAGFLLLGLSRYWRAPGVAAPRGPPAAPGLAERIWIKMDAFDKRLTGAKRIALLPATIVVSLIRSGRGLWETARADADSQTHLEALAGGSSLSSLRDWFVGGLRAAAAWIPVGLGGMVAGWALAKPFAHLVSPDDMVGMLSFDTLQKYGLSGHLLGYVASTLAAQAVTLGVFDALRALASKLGAGRAAGWIGAAAALAVSAGLVLTVTTTPSVVASMIGIEAAALGLRARSNSWLAPLALRAIFTLLSLEAARFAVLVALGPVAGAALAGLPVYAGAAVAGMLLTALGLSAGSLRPAALWSALKAQAARVTAFGEAWHTPRHDGAPHSPWPLFKLAALWGSILYALGDAVFYGVHLVAGGVEPTPAALVQMLTAPTDLVLYNFLLVGFLEEFVFRRGPFKAIYSRLKKWGMTKGPLFWTAAVVSGLIFSGAHYIDFGAVLAKLHMADQATSSGLGGMYAFTLAGFATRAALGVALAWLYAESGTLFLPILAHFAADSLEGLGLHWGLLPFLAMVAGTLAIQRAWFKRK